MALSPLLRRFPRRSGAPQVSSAKVEVGKCEQRKYLRAVLGNATITNAAVTELAFHDAEYMLNLGADDQCFQAT
jgi:hypothetical protein